MFIHDFAYIPLPYSVVRARLLDDSASWIRVLAQDANSAGEELSVRVGPYAARRFGASAVDLHLGVPYDRHGSLILPLSWLARTAPELFPAMDADLEVAPVGDSTTQLTLSGVYEPPFGLVGKAIDTFLLHRLNEAAVRSFLERLVRGFETVTDLAPAASG